MQNPTLQIIMHKLSLLRSRALTSALVLPLFLALAPLAVNAASTSATTVGFQISPPVQTLALDPGTSTRRTIKVTNLTNDQMTLLIGKANFVSKGEEGEVELIDGADPLYSLSPYFSISQPTLTIAPRSTAEMQYSLSVPKDAEPGGRYGSITFNTIAAKLPTGQSGAAVKQQLAALVFLRINGPANEQLKIASFAPDKSFYEYGPINFTARIHNVGNVHEKPSGTIVIKNMLGFTTATINVDPKQVIPQAIRRMPATLNKRLLFGNYTATLTLHNGTVQTLTATTKFSVIPYRLLAVILIIAIVVLFVFLKIRKRLRRAWRILAGKE